MTLNPFAPRRPLDDAEENDHGVALVALFLLALVFAPVIGVHVVFLAIGTSPASAPATPDEAVHASRAKPLRG